MWAAHTLPKFPVGTTTLTRSGAPVPGWVQGEPPLEPSVARNQVAT